MLIQDQVNVFQLLSYIQMWWAYIGTLSDFGTLFRHNTTTRLPTPGIELAFRVEHTIAHTH